jgi:hypothetical protein
MARVTGEPIRKGMIVGQCLRFHEDAAVRGAGSGRVTPHSVESARGVAYPE